MYGYYEEKGFRLYAVEENGIVVNVHNYKGKWYYEYSFRREGETLSDVVWNESRGYSEGPYETLDEIEMNIILDDKIDSLVLRAVNRAKGNGER